MLFRRLNVFCLFAALLAAGMPARAADTPALSAGQTLYLPVYSFLWHGNLKKGYPDKTLVSVLVSVRNTDPKQAIRLVSARYYDTAGKQLHEYMTAPKTIPPMGTYELYVERQEKAGGSGANFLLVWQADNPLNPPVVEGVHADIQGHRTLSFVTGARPLHPSRTE